MTEVKPPMFQVGDRVVALVDGGRDGNDLPLDVPIAGQEYVITSLYAMPYGIGCTLEGMMHGPYNGYILMTYGADKRRRYFRKVEQ